MTIPTCDMTHLRVQHNSCLHVTWLIYELTFTPKNPQQASNIKTTPTATIRFQSSHNHHTTSSPASASPHLLDQAIQLSALPPSLTNSSPTPGRHTHTRTHTPTDTHKPDEKANRPKESNGEHIFFEFFWHFFLNY